MKRIVSLLIPTVLIAGLLTGSMAPAATAGIATKAGGRYVVLARSGVSAADAEAVIRSSGGRIVKSNERVGVSTVKATDPSFGTRLMGSGLFTGIARDRVIGRAPTSLMDRLSLRRGTSVRPYSAADEPPRGMDPLGRFQWNLNMVDADFGGSYSHEQGDRRVLVGIMDTGVEARHRDLRKTVNRTLGRNFTRDIPSIDGRCRDERDRSCEDPPNQDTNGHGSWVASTVGASLDGFGMSGVAPGITLVSLRVIQDSGYAFLQPTIDALTYAADNGIDVVNMSYFVDPWMFNCADNEADSEAAQLEQQTIIAAVQAAVDYARERGVTLVGALANSWTDLDNPQTDGGSPNFPPGSGYEREIDDTCLLLPAEAEGVIGVSSVGPSGRKAWYSNYGLDATDVAAPGGDDFDAALPYHYNMPLGVAPMGALKEYGILRKNGKPRFPEFVRRCTPRGKCFYYYFGGGTSFAAPVATGVAALIVSRSGTDDGTGGLTMPPDAVEQILLATTEQPGCPEGGVQEYPEIGDFLVQFGLPSWEAYSATCEEGPEGRNGLFGHGIVNAYNAVTYRP